MGCLVVYLAISLKKLLCEFSAKIMGDRAPGWCFIPTKASEKYPQLRWDDNDISIDPCETKVKNIISDMKVISRFFLLT